MSQIIKQIRDAFPALAPSKKRVASYFLNNFSTLYLDTVMELSEKIGVSDTTIINLCTDLGFYGYSGFKKAVRDEIKNESSGSITADDHDQNEVISTLTEALKKDSEAIEKTVSDRENQAAVKAAIDLMSKAGKIYIVGFYWGAGIAKANALRLLHSGYDAEAIYPDMGDYIDHLLLSKSGDVAIVYDPSLYTTALTEICSFLKEKGVSIVLVTDMGPCPRLEQADVVIHCMEGSTGNGSIEITGYALIKEMISTFIKLCPRDTVEYNRGLRQGIFSKYNTYGVYEPTADSEMGRI